MKARWTSNFSQFAKQNRSVVREAMNSLIPWLRQRILSHTANASPGKLHKTGVMRQSLEIRTVAGANPRWEIKSVDYGGYQDRGFQHVNNGWVQNPWISAEIRAKRQFWLSKIAERVRKYTAQRSK